jgi:hypothetical protein
MVEEWAGKAAARMVEEFFIFEGEEKDLEAPVILELEDRAEGQVWVEVIDLPPDYAQEREVTVLGAYKPVAKKKRPVATTMEEEDKPLMKLPEDLWSGLKEVQAEVAEWRKQPEGKRFTAARRAELMEGLTDFLSEKEKDMLAMVLLNNEDALAWVEEEKGGFREEYIPPVKIPAVPHTPWQDRGIRLPVKTREKVIAFLKDKMANGLYERSQSSYRSGFFAVEKKDGRIRIVHDLQKLNSFTIRDSGLPPRMDEMTEEMAGCLIYTGFDAFAGYDQVALHPSSRDLTAFESPMGTLRLCRLPQGWTNAVAMFQRVMEFVFAEELHKDLHVYIDGVDVCGPRRRIKGPDGKEAMAAPGVRKFVYLHAQQINKILHKMKRLGGTFSGGKVQLGVPEIEMVGYMCSAEGRRITKRALSKVLNWPTPENPTGVRGFLGVVGIARSWVKGYGAKAKRLVELTKVTQAEFLWTEAHDEAFEAVKRAVEKSGYIRPIDYTVVEERPPIVAIDSSQQGCGVELAQEDENGKRRTARFLSFYFNELQQRYSQPKLELYGVFVGLRALRHWIHGTRFILEVDCTSLKQMINSPMLPTAAEGRWCWYIKMNDFIFMHVPGEKHKVPDGLSRRPRNLEADTDSDTDPEEWLDAHCGEVTALSGAAGGGGGNSNSVRVSAGEGDSGVRTSAQGANSNSVRVSPEESSEDESSSEDDSEIPNGVFHRSLYAKGSRWRDVLAKEPWGKHLTRKQKSAVRHLALNCWLSNGRVVRSRVGRLPATVLGKKEDIERVLKGLHEEHGHKGVKATMLKVSDRFVWDGMSGDVKHWVSSCPDCQARDKLRFEDIRARSDAPTIFSRLAIDVVYMPRNQVMGPLPEGVVPEKAIVVLRDDLTGWVEAQALPEINSTLVARFFFEQVVCRFGLVGHVSSDNGSEFLGAFKDLLVHYGIPQVYISAYNPEGNAMVERGHAPIKEALFKMMRSLGGDWVSLLPFVLWADRTTAKRTTGYTPHYLLYGAESVLPIDAEYKTFLVGNWSEEMSTSELLAARARQLQRLPQDRALASRLAAAAREESLVELNSGRDRRHLNRAFRKNQLVLVRNVAQENSKAIPKEDRYFGPYRVLEVSSTGAVRLCELDGSPVRDAAMAQVAHSRVRRFIPRIPDPEMENPDNAEDSNSVRVLPGEPRRPTRVTSARQSRQGERLYRVVWSDGSADWVVDQDMADWPDWPQLRDSWTPPSRARAPRRQRWFYEDLPEEEEEGEETLPEEESQSTLRSGRVRFQEPGDGDRTE